MSNLYPAGPSGTASWEKLTVDVGSARRAAVLVLADAASEERTAAGQPACAYVVSAAPRVVRGRNQEPVFTLTLLLRQAPEPGAVTVYPLIERGILGVDLRLGLPPKAFEEMRASGKTDYRRLFIREGTVTLIREVVGAESVLASCPVSGAEARGSLSATLNRAETLAVLAALDGTPSNMHLRAQGSFRAAGARQRIRLYGSWAAIYDVLYQHRDPNGELSLSQLQHLVLELLETGALSVVDASSSTVSLELNRAAVFMPFMRMSAVILERRPGLGPMGSEERYRLRGRPYESLHLDYTQVLSGSVNRTLTLEAPLEEVLGGLLDGWDWDAYLHLVSPEQGSGGLSHMTRQRGRARRSCARNDQDPSISLAVIDGSVRSLASATLPAVVAASPAAFSAAGTRPIATTAPLQIQHAIWDDLVLDLPNRPDRRSLPVVDDPSSALWPDRFDSSRYWYAPTFELVRPAPNEDPSTSPFLFSYERMGVTSDGRPALRGTVRFTLCSTPRPETQAELNRLNRSRAVAVALKNLSASLLLPFVDARDGRLKTHQCAAATELDGDTLRLVVKLQNEWVRLCYGALAEEGFQQVAARLHLAYSFDAYVRVRERELTLSFGGKALYTPVAYSAEEAQLLSGRPFLDAHSLTYHLPDSEVRFKREVQPDGSNGAAGSPSTSERNEGAGTNAAGSLMARPVIGTLATPTITAVTATPVTTTPVAPAKPATATGLATRPQLTVVPPIADLLQRVEYATRTQLRQERQDVLFPCNTLGVFYREGANGNSVPIGCQDALRLGQTIYRQYEEIEELSHEDYRLFRSLQQPERFLVVPARYCITRHGPGAPGAYRPALLLWAVLDPETQSNNRVNLDVALQPDLSPSTRRDILARLGAYARNPTIQYPTEIPDTSIEDDWRLDRAINIVELQARGPLLHTMLAADVPGWVSLKARLETIGVEGSVRFTLPDDSVVSSELLLKLDHIAGPWDGGAVEVVLSERTARLTNRIEQHIDVHDLVVYQGLSAATSLPVELQLSPEASHTVTLDGAATEVYPVYKAQRGDLAMIEEVRSFIENIYRSIAFINLVNFSNHGLARLEIQARVKEVEGNYHAQLTASMPVVEVEVILSLVTYMFHHALQYRITKVFTTGERTSTVWFEINLTDSAMISITWDMIQ